MKFQISVNLGGRGFPKTAFVLTERHMLLVDYAKRVEDLRKVRLDNISGTIGIIAKVGAGIGTVAVFFYCFFVAGFYPSGLGVGDTLFFLFVVLGIGITGGALSGLGLVALAPWMLRDRAGTHLAPGPIEHAAAVALVLCSAFLLFCVRAYFVATIPQNSLGHDIDPTWVGREGWALSLALIPVEYYLFCASLLLCNILSGIAYTLLWLFLGIGLGACLSVLDDTAAWMFALTILGGGTYMALGISSLEGSTKGTTSAWVGIFFLLVAVGLPFVSGNSDRVFGFVFESMGIRAQNVTIIVSRKNYQVLQAAAEAKGILLRACELAEDSHAISSVDILWHGIGERSYVAIGNELPRQGKTTPRLWARVELDRAGMNKTAAIPQQSCTELQNGLYFTSGEGTLSHGQWSVGRPIIESFLEDTNTWLDTGSQYLLITGQADPMTDKRTGNPLLARRRACHVYERIMELKAARSQGQNRPLSCRPEFQSYIGIRVGAGDPGCGTRRKSDEQRGCYETARRVTLQRINAPFPPKRVGIVPASVACRSVGPKAETARETKARK